MVVIGSSTRGILIIKKETKKSNIPGPGHYNPFAHHSKTLPKWSMGTEKRNDLGK